MSTWRINCTVSFNIEADSDIEAIVNLSHVSFQLTKDVILVEAIVPYSCNEILPVVKIHAISIPENYFEVFTILEMRVIAECVNPIDVNKVITKMLSEHYYPLATPDFMINVMKKLVEKGYMEFLK